MSIANWTIVPWLIAAAVISAVFCIWEFLGTGKNGVETDSRRRVGENQLESDKRHYNIIPTELDPFRNRTSISSIKMRSRRNVAHVEHRLL
jgi:hypothetical protein